MPTTIIPRVDLGLFVSNSKVALTLDNFLSIKPCAATGVWPTPQTRHSNRYLRITLKRTPSFQIVQTNHRTNAFYPFHFLKFDSTGLLQGIQLQGIRQTKKTVPTIARGKRKATGHPPPKQPKARYKTRFNFILFTSLDS